MLKEFKTIPEPLQKKIIMLVGFSLFALLIFVFLLITLRSFGVALPGIFLFAFFGFCAFRLLVIAGTNDYTVISGICSKVNLTAIKKRTKSVTLLAEGKTVKVVIKQRLKRIEPGATVDVYVYKNTQMFSIDNEYLLPTHIALDVK